jgi:hypothetical protein
MRGHGSCQRTRPDDITGPSAHVACWLRSKTTAVKLKLMKDKTCDIFSKLESNN